MEDSKSTFPVLGLLKIGISYLHWSCPPRSSAQGRGGTYGKRLQHRKRSDFL